MPDCKQIQKLIDLIEMKSKGCKTVYNLERLIYMGDGNWYFCGTHFSFVGNQVVIHIKGDRGRVKLRGTFEEVVDILRKGIYA